uniref:Uncharacterized protein n=1 Tax=Panagrolaimus davidi TaxID=227884 RepID=A0A914QCI1_9BILA
MEYICKKFTLGRGNKLDLRLDSPLELPGNQWYCGLKEFSLEQKWSLANDMITIHYQNGLKSIVKPGFYHSVNEIDKVLEEMFSVPRKKRNVVGNITGVNDDEEEEQTQQVIYVDDEEGDTESPIDKKSDVIEKEEKKEESEKKEIEQVKEQTHIEKNVDPKPELKKKKEPIMTKIGFDFEKVGPDVVLTYDKHHIPEHIRKPPIIHEGGREGLTAEKENKRKLQKEIEEKKNREKAITPAPTQPAVTPAVTSAPTPAPTQTQETAVTSAPAPTPTQETAVTSAPAPTQPAITPAPAPTPTQPAITPAQSEADKIDSETQNITSGGQPPQSSEFIWDSDTDTESESEINTNEKVKESEDEKVAIPESDEILPHAYDDSQEPEEQEGVKDDKTSEEAHELLPHAYDDPKSEEEQEGVKDDKNRRGLKMIKI